MSVGSTPSRELYSGEHFWVVGSTYGGNIWELGVPGVRTTWNGDTWGEEHLNRG